MEEIATHSCQFIGPFTELLPMSDLPEKGAIRDEQLRVEKEAGLLIANGKVSAYGPYADVARLAETRKAKPILLPKNTVGIPGFIDSHTHSCFAGSRAKDYALRNSGSTYLEIAQAGGGIWDTVTHTREASFSELEELLIQRCQRFLAQGITTLEVKSGYGLSVDEELKMLRVIQSAGKKVFQDLIPTCLAAHMLPKDFGGDAMAYLEHLTKELLPVIKSEGLSNRIDAFIEAGAFSPEEISPYFRAAQKMGFDLTVHADQFSTGGSAAAITLNARSADHLEASGEVEIRALAQSNVVATALPGASLGLGCAFTPARALLDAGACLSIASDYNPGSAPMGDLLSQAAILGTMEKLSNAEVLAGITTRAAAALGLQDRGSLEVGKTADLIIFPTSNYQEITYHQGQLKPSMIWKNGHCVL
jgi:imidazolonepropionase